MAGKKPVAVSKLINKKGKKEELLVSSPPKPRKMTPRPVEQEEVVVYK